ncbi:MAG: hypothetical protein COA78_14890 [Blastopirellula sp.]|nr:MAG: hypothetical protein COA78_14890 [Blastopirellula sp.]
MTDRPTLAVYTKLRREGLGMTRPALAKQLGLTTRQIELCEIRGRLGKKARSALINFNQLEGV